MNSFRLRPTIMFIKLINISILSFIFAASSLLAKEHTVKKRDRISSIAAYYGVSPKDLMKENGIKKAKKLSLGDILIIPEKMLGNARRKHKIKNGDTVAKIAKRYGVSRKELKTLNKINNNKELKLGRTLAIPNKEGDSGPDIESEKSSKKSLPKPKWEGGVKGLTVTGEKTDKGVYHIVQKRQTLKMIARAYNIDSKKLGRKNKVTKKNPLKPGDKIFIEGAPVLYPVRTGHYKPHKVTIVYYKFGKPIKLKIINKNGFLAKGAKNKIGRLLGYKHVKPKLIELIQRVAERFPGKAINIVSGYRPHPKRKKTRSYHSRNAAIDFKIQGVSNELIYEFISSFEKVGAGYYPNSTHVHLDTRDVKFLWTDVSAKGESASYADDAHPQHFSNVKIDL